MAFTITSRNTFHIPADITDISSGATAVIKRISADGAVPVILRGTNVWEYQIKPQNYIVYDSPAVEYRKIESVTTNDDGTVDIQLLNTLGEHWNDFPTVDTVCMWSEAYDYIPYVSALVPYVNFFYAIKATNTENLVLDVVFKKDATNLTIDIYTFAYEITKEVVRKQEIYDEANYIHEVYDTAGTISSRILTITSTGTYRIPMDILLVDQLLLIKCTDTTANLELKLDIRENQLGYRYPLIFKTV